MLNYFAFFIAVLMVSTSVKALSPLAEEGKVHFVLCNACHDPNLDPPKGSPMFGVQRRYTRAYGTKEEVVKRIVAFVKQPSEDKALMRNAVKNLGLMPAMPLPDDMLNKIAHYIYEETFSPPCKHWEFAIKRLKDQPEQANHLMRDKRKYEQLCQ